MTTPTPERAAAILAAAKFYARASAQRAVHGAIPEPDPDADDANWERTRIGIQTDCLAMVSAILQAAEFPAKMKAAGERAIAMVTAYHVKRGMKP